MSKIEQLETGLFLARGFAREEFAYSFTREHLPMVLAYKYFEDPDYDSKTVIQLNPTVKDVLGVGQPATTHLLRCLLQAYPKADRFTLNYQPGYSKQEFHIDDTIGPVLIFSGGDGGYFDYAPGASNESEAEKGFESIEVNAGDMLIKLAADLWHRGRNSGADPRITAGLWEGIPLNDTDLLGAEADRDKLLT